MGQVQVQETAYGSSVCTVIFQETMNRLLGNLDYVSVYIDNILILLKEDEPDEEHLWKIETVLGRLQDTGFRGNIINPSLCNHRLDTLVTY